MLVQNRFLPKLMYLPLKCQQTPPSSSADNAKKLTKPEFLRWEDILSGRVRVRAFFMCACTFVLGLLGWLIGFPYLWSGSGYVVELPKNDRNTAG